MIFDPQFEDMNVLNEFVPQSNAYFVSSCRPKLDVLNDEGFKQNLINQEHLILENLCEIEALERAHY